VAVSPEIVSHKLSDAAIDPDVRGNWIENENEYLLVAGFTAKTVIEYPRSS
jgi:hypothetical protein